MNKSLSRRGWIRLALLVLGVLAAVALLRVAGADQYLSPEHLGKVRQGIEDLGVLGPLAYILLYAAATTFFLPGLPLTVLAGLFGVVRGTVYASIGSLIGASLAFLLARYALRPMVEDWLEEKPAFRRIDEGVRAHGWRMVMVTRLVPVFPFNLQNYAYGLTGIRFTTYVLVSWMCMLPGTMAYVFAGGSIVSGEGNLGRTFFYLAVAAVAFVVLSFLPRLISRRYLMDGGPVRRGSG